jgi:hypothetical protein
MHTTMKNTVDHPVNVDRGYVWVADLRSRYDQLRGSAMQLAHQVSARHACVHARTQTLLAAEAAVGHFFFFATPPTVAAGSWL